MKRTQGRLHQTLPEQLALKPLLKITIRQLLGKHRTGD